MNHAHKWMDKLPSLFTTLNLAFGVIAIHHALFGNFVLSAWFIIWAVICDGMDGKLARWRQCETEFGLQLDSLSDFVSFGVAPAMLFSVGVFRNWSFITLLLIIFYVYAGGYRLARFNAIDRGDRTRGYRGLPIPVSGMTLAAFWLFMKGMGRIPDPLTAAAMLLVSGVLMISHVPYYWPRLMFHQGGLKAFASAGLLIGVFLMAFFPETALFPLLTGYIVVGIARHIRRSLRGWSNVTLFSDHFKG